MADTPRVRVCAAGLWTALVLAAGCLAVTATHAATRAEDGHEGTHDAVADTHDRDRTLLAPSVLLNSGFVGGAEVERITGAAVDAAGYIYVVGDTRSSEDTFPVRLGPDLDYNGRTDAFVAKLSPNASQLIYCGYIGGSGVDIAEGVAVDADGSAYVVGETSSTDGSFPATRGPDLTHGGHGDAFIAKVAPEGDRLEYCGFIGGDGEDAASAVAVDTTGRAYVVGSSWSFGENVFPPELGAGLPPGGDEQDGFVARVLADGSGFDYAGFIGGGEPDSATGVAVDRDGAAYVTGDTTSQDDSFPVRRGPDLTYNGYLLDGFIAKVRPSGRGLEYCGYIGGGQSDSPKAVAVDEAGEAYVVGETRSTQGRFPVRVGPDRSYNGGDADGFVAKVRSDGRSLLFCGYVGGGRYDAIESVALSSDRRVYVAGWTVSPSRFPVTRGLDRTYNGGYTDAFVAEVRSDGRGLWSCGYVGGTGDDYAAAIAAGPSRKLYVGGWTDSGEDSFPVRGTGDLTANGDYDGWIASFAFPSGR